MKSILAIKNELRSKQPDFRLQRASARIDKAITALDRAQADLVGIAGMEDIRASIIELLGVKL